MDLMEWVWQIQNGIKQSLYGKNEKVHVCVCVQVALISQRICSLPWPTWAHSGQCTVLSTVDHTSRLNYSGEHMLKWTRILKWSRQTTMQSLERCIHKKGMSIWNVGCRNFLMLGAIDEHFVCHLNAFFRCARKRANSRFIKRPGIVRLAAKHGSAKVRREEVGSRMDWQYLS